MKWRSKKTMIGGPLVVVILAVILMQVFKSEDNTTEVQADLAYRDDLSEVVTASGRIQPQTKVDITSEVSAQIMEVPVKDGQRVSRGEILLLLDTVQLQSDVAQARYSLEELTARAEAARTQYERDELERERQGHLFDQKLTSETAFTNARLTAAGARANHDAMKAQVNTARARLEKAADNLTKTRITAPMAGVITYLNADPGEIAQAQTSFTQGKTLMTISDLSVFEVEVDVDETEVAKLRLDQTSEINVDAFADTTFPGSVVEIGNSARVEGEGTENYTTSFRVKVRFAETDAAIRPGMSATVDITTATAEDAILIPYASVVTREFPDDTVAAPAPAETGGAHAAETEPESAAALPDTADAEGDAARAEGSKRNKKSKKHKKTGVFVCKEGEAKFVELTTGIADERNIVALGGLEPGDTVISGTFQTLRKLAEGDQVKIDDSSLERMKEES